MPRKKKKASKKKELTPKQKRFIECYDGNATQAALKAGYSAKTVHVQGPRLLANVRIREEIEKRESKAAASGIATREDRQKFWSDMMVSGERAADRLKASELLGKSQADFTDKVLVGGLEQTLQELDDNELNRRIRQLESAQAALRLEVGESPETLQ